MVPFHRACQVPSTAWHRDPTAQTWLSQIPLAWDCAPGFSFWPPAVTFVDWLLQLAPGPGQNQSPVTIHGLTPT